MIRIKDSEIIIKWVLILIFYGFVQQVCLMKWQLGKNLPQFWMFVLFFISVNFFLQILVTLTRAFIRGEGSFTKQKTKKLLYMCFHIPKILQILKRFSGTFYQTLTSMSEEYRLIKTDSLTFSSPPIVFFFQSSIQSE